MQQNESKMLERRSHLQTSGDHEVSDKGILNEGAPSHFDQVRSSDGRQSMIPNFSTLDKNAKSSHRKRKIKTYSDSSMVNINRLSKLRMSPIGNCRSSMDKTRERLSAVLEGRRMRKSTNP